MVRLSILSSLAGLATASLWVDEAPDHVRPYVIEHYANSHSLTIGSQLYRFMVTGESSGGAFTLMQTNSPYSGSLGVLPHIHQKHHENFFSFKGRSQLWTDKANDSTAKLLTAGDYGSCPTNTTHTFQFVDPDTELIGVIVPGGFEALFYFLGDANVTFSTETPFVPANVSDSAGSGSSPSIISELESFDVYAALSFTPRRDIVNGTAPANSTWHDGASTIPTVAGKPYFVASGWGPKYLTGKYGGWQIIQPFVTPTTGEHNFTQGSLTMSRTPANVTVPTWNLTEATAFQVLEGSVKITMANETATLISGDAAFMPGGTPFQYESGAAFSKLMYIGAGDEGLDQQLLNSAMSWGYTSFPTYWP
ncbi:quercetin 2,3-dioxygenase anaerobically complexed with the substrate kaempferol [Teratosphaeria nubilosa]|uniref:Quercetin 2,3-dioxygenase anaerobically complexed with the substrate kaempferol n=1 Tax=Teratosphaeria nubilosa TaxID=161662 RepID=A0A6G1KVV3_9PEZI|nr:quercetin 2,3-dioxygenase anaerobically complexed with the substrate kaempferol [Teratosphaeria nubilosa]